jgi:hypothetical protein
METNTNTATDFDFEAFLAGFDLENATATEHLAEKTATLGSAARTSEHAI